LLVVALVSGNRDNAGKCGSWACNLNNAGDANINKGVIGKMKMFKSESGAMPLPIDDESSPTTVYVNENVVESERTDEMTGEISTVYRYDVRLYSREEWEKLQMANRIIDLECALIDAEGEI
jgi:hypothetical protein